MEKKEKELKEAIEAVNENQHQDLGKEQLGNEPELVPDTPDSKYKMEGYEDKRPESDEIEKGWTVGSNTSRGPEDQ